MKLVMLPYSEPYTKETKCNETLNLTRQDELKIQI